VAAATLCGALVITGCGGAADVPVDGSTGGAGATAAACSDFAACGGDIVGTWRTSAACAPPARISGSICQGDTFELGAVKNQMTWSFSADRSFTLGLSTTGAGKVTVPSPCVVSGGATVACADVGAMYVERIRFVGASITSGPCQEAGGMCSCPLTFAADPAAMAAGTYALSGTSLTFMLGDDVGMFSYCVAGRTMKWQSASTGGLLPGVSVLDRQ
jgi:hypothetical protein